ncbi:hypothetical protein EV188_102491 [Actinomycetospora succinea]|uniref:Uncharacterized protein n=1 Tax=Actinomycetospora succinea TaxID=663603 RepID=A0A4R6VLK4_9PSEU|nr:hypothetical protein [Actinomycetospora succinea]TDQ62835.1 hypothetical protein EV188_102491 [Actinomycetospora succinea]
MPDLDDERAAVEVDLSAWIAEQDVVDLAQYARAARLVHGSFGRFLVDAQ